MLVECVAFSSVVLLSMLFDYITDKDLNIINIGVLMGVWCGYGFYLIDKVIF